MNRELEQIHRYRVLPIIVIDKVEHAAPLGDALIAGGLPVVEVTFRTPAAEDAVKSLAKSGDLLVGAGTILTTEQVDRAIDAGARFLVAPGTNPKVIQHSLERGVPLLPGVVTPTEIELALSLGVEALKFFPAETVGGIAALKAFAGPYPDARFIPTGGITPELVPDYLSLSSVLACGGSWMAPRDLLASGRFDAITMLVEQAAKLFTPPPDVAT